MFSKNENNLDSLDYEAKLLARFFAACKVLSNGTVIETKQQVARIGNVVIKIYPREHMPPHFHVTHDDNEAIYRIDNCELIEGSLGSDDDKIVKYWFRQGGKSILEKVWENTRPGDCIVGTYQAGGHKNVNT